MIDNYAWAAIGIRFITLVIAVVVIEFIIKLLRKQIEDQWIKYFFALFVGIIALNATWALAVNFYRTPDGNLIREIRHLTLIFNSVSGLAGITGWYFLLREDK